MSRALVLFDVDGNTATVNTAKLNPEAKKSAKVTLCMAKKRYTVEVLEVADNTDELDQFEVEWSRTHRAIAIDKEIERRQRTDQAEGGFLEVWPADSQDTNMTNNQQQESDEQVNTDTIQHEEPADQAAAPRRKRQQKQITGNNGRMITVLATGAGDYSRRTARPKQQPGQMTDLTEDQADLVQIQMRNRLHGMVSVGQQTDTVIVLAEDKEIRDFIDGQKKKTTDTSTQTPSSFDFGNKLDTILSILNSLKEFNTNARSSQPMSYPLENIDDTLTDFLNVLVSNTPSTPTRSNMTALNNTPIEQTTSTPIQTRESTIATTPPSTTPIQTTAETTTATSTTSIQTRDVTSTPATTSPNQIRADTITPTTSNSSMHTRDTTSTTATSTSSIQTRHTTSPTTTTTSTTDTVTTPATAPSTQSTYTTAAATSTSKTTTICEATMQSLTSAEDIPALNPPTLPELSSTIILPDLDNIIHEEPVPLSIQSISESTKFGKTPMIKCFSGPMQLVSSHLDSATPLQELRVHPNIQSECYLNSCRTPSNFVWKLTQKIYRPTELQGRNYTGQKGKMAISPRRKHAILHAVIDTYGRDQLKIVGPSINNGIRNLNRKMPQQQD